MLVHLLHVFFPSNDLPPTTDRGTNLPSLLLEALQRVLGASGSWSHCSMHIMYTSLLPIIEPANDRERKREREERQGEKPLSGLSYSITHIPGTTDFYFLRRNDRRSTAVFEVVFPPLTRQQSRVIFEKL